MDNRTKEWYTTALNVPEVPDEVAELHDVLLAMDEVYSAGNAS